MQKKNNKKGQINLFKNQLSMFYCFMFSAGASKNFKKNIGILIRQKLKKKKKTAVM